MSAPRIKFRRARKHYRCPGDWAHCRRIEPGDTYAEVTEYPGSDAGYAETAGHPIVWRYCAECGRHMLLVVTR